MNKAELINSVAEAHELSKAKAERVVNGILDTITTEVAKGEKVTITGFGTFERHNRAATTAVNPQTKEKIDVEAKVVPHFRAGNGFKEAVAKG